MDCHWSIDWWLYRYFLWTSLSEIWMVMQTFIEKKSLPIVSSAKGGPFCLGPNVLFCVPSCVNVLYISTSRAIKKQYETCPLCQSEPETVNHFILRCPFFQTERCHFFDCVKNFSPHLSMKSDLPKLAYILDLRCPPESIRVCCKYIYKVYTRRERCVIWNICIPSDIWLLLSVMSPWES